MEYKVINEIRGTIVKITDCDGKKTCVVMQPDDSNLGTIGESYRGRDYSNFNVGQRCVYAKFVMCNPANDDEIKMYNDLRKRNLHGWRLMFNEKVFDDFFNSEEKNIKKKIIIDDTHEVVLKKRLVTLIDIERCFFLRDRCPDIVTDYDYEAYNELKKSKGR